MSNFSNAQQILYRDKLLSGTQMKVLIDATRQHMNKYVLFDDDDYSMVATIADTIELDIKIKVKGFVPIIEGK